jgi:hypothetical protein
MNGNAIQVEDIFESSIRLPSFIELVGESFVESVSFLTTG